MKAFLCGSSNAILGGVENQHPRRLATTLRDLDDSLRKIFQNYESETKLDEHYSNIRNGWNNFVDGFQNETIIFYYNGHAFITKDSVNIALSFEGTDLHYGDHLTVRQVVDSATSSNNRFIFIFDCCHGAITEDSLMPLRNNCYCILASSEGYAFEGPEGSYFSKELIEALNFQRIRMDDLRIDRAERAVTWKRVFDHCTRQLSLRARQLPKLFRQKPRDFGELGRLPLVEFPITIPDALNEGAFRNTIYFKLFVILSNLSSNGRCSDSELYELVKNDPSRSFVTQDNSNGKRWVSFNRFQEFLRTLASLDLIVYSRSYLELTDIGKTAAEKNRYNITLTRQIFLNQFPDGYDEKQFYSDIVELMKECNVASPRNVINVLKQVDPDIGIDYPIFKDCFSLLGYTQLFGRAPIGSIFPKLFGMR